MTPYDIAKTFVGTREVPGTKSNPEIIAMFRAVGHEWVEDDSLTAWCAAFVGACIERAGLRSTRRLNARSYLDWAEPIRPSRDDVLTDGTLEQIVAHNEIGERLCGWRP